MEQHTTFITKFMKFTTITLNSEGPVAIVTLSRPEVHNAFNAAMVAELRECFAALADEDSIRTVVLTGSGNSFCAGADLNWMQASLSWTREQNIADAKELAAMFETIWTLPKPLIGRINGRALGGGVGLIACCDIAIAIDTARLGFSEVKLGLIPAVISQYVVPKIGLSQARALFISGERFTAERAFEINLVHAVTTEEELDTTVNSIVKRLLSSAPKASGATKRLIDAVWSLEREAGQRYVIEAIADARTSAEGQEGLRAFLEKREPKWIEESRGRG